MYKHEREETREGYTYVLSKFVLFIKYIWLISWRMTTYMRQVACKEVIKRSQ